MLEKRSHMWRYMAIAVLFCVISVIYLGRLFYIQISGRGDGYQTGTTVKTVTVQAVRGEIYDRNGNALVSNRYTYDLILSYDVFSSTNTTTLNQSCLYMLEGLAQNPEDGKNLRTEAFFPLDGTYPNYTLSAEAADGDSIVYYRMRRVISDLSLDEDTGVEELVEHYLSLYELKSTKINGKKLTDQQIDALIRLYYDMDAVRFRTAGEYQFAENVGLPAMTYIKELSVSLANFRVNAARVYNYPGYASHILGTVGPIYSEEWEYYNEQGYQMSAIVGKSGCEAAFEKYLRGSDGVLEIELDASGNLIRSAVKKEPVAGQDVYLTIDINLQIAAEDGLAENVRQVAESANGLAELGAGCRAGAAVAIDPNDFSVLALASYPTYDLNTYRLLYDSLAASEAKPLLNRALNGLYEPGSTYKLGVAAAALMEGLTSADERIQCTESYNRFDGYRPKCSTYRQHPMDRLNVREAIADSCNIFFYEMGYRFFSNSKLDTLSAYMKGFGIGQDTGLELGGARGTLANPDQWNENEVGGLTLQAAIGQADTRVTPMQLSCYLGTLLGGGTRYAAHLLYGVSEFGSSLPPQKTAPTVLDQTDIDPWVLGELRGGMEQVVRENATVNRNMSAILEHATVGAKTGTAQNGRAADNALFVCASPTIDPEIVISVVLEEGYGGSYASLTAARILETYYGIEN